MVVYAFEDPQSLHELENALRHIIGDILVFKGFSDTHSFYHAAYNSHYDIAIANMEHLNRSGIKMFANLCMKYPTRNFIGVSTEERHGDSLMLLKYHASGYIKKPYDTETLMDSLQNLRLPVK